MNISTIRYVVTPFIAPASPALVSSVGLYNELILINWNAGIALFTAIVLGLTMEISGGFLAKGFSDFWAKQAWLRMILAGSGLLIYTLVGVTFVWGIWGLVGLPFLTLFLYLTIAAQDTFQEEKHGQIEQSKHDIELAKLNSDKAKYDASAERAKARASSFGSEKVPKKSVVNEKVRRYLATLDDPGAALLSEIADHCAVSLSTASVHKNRFIKIEGKHNVQ